MANDDDDNDGLSELPIPPDAQEVGGHEVLRAFVVNGGLSVSLQRALDEPHTWGVLLVDLAHHVARIYAKIGVNRRTAAAAWARARGFDGERLLAREGV